MALAETVGIHFHFRDALIAGTLIALAATLYVTPRAIQKLRGARIVGRDRHKEGRPEIPEMGGLAVFVAFNMGAFAALAISRLESQVLTIVLASLLVVAGATFTGALDDLIVLRQRFKAGLPFAFAAPLALFVSDFTIWLPLAGGVDFGLLYPLVLVPAGIACASNGFNMLEGFNGMGTGIGIISALALSVIILLIGDISALVLLAPLLGALAAFWIFNAFPAKIFPGDTLLLQLGAILACGSIIGKVEFWGALLFLPHIVEFFLKARGKFKDPSFASSQEGPMLFHNGPTRSLAHIALLRPGTEPQVVNRILTGHLVYATTVVVLVWRVVL